LERLNLLECDECRAIVADYMAANRALAREMLESRLGSDKEFAEAWHQARKLETEEDVVLAEELFPAIQFNSSPRVHVALSRMLAHEVRTGHKVRHVIHKG
jgi:hypothetical protein